MLLVDEADASRLRDCWSLDEVADLEAGDPAWMLPAVASGAAQVREAAVLLRAARRAWRTWRRTGGRGRSWFAAWAVPASPVTCSRRSAARGAPVPVPLPHRGYGLPGWVGAADVVVAVSCSGTTEETLSALEEAVRRGLPAARRRRPPGSPLEALARPRPGALCSCP